ncbi:TPA: phage tail spike protein, partial [Streptococcus suis]
VELKGLNADELEQVEYMAIQTMEDAHTFHYFYVAQKSSDELTTLIGVQSGIEELRKSPVYDKRPQNAFARDVITDLLAGTNWQARFVGETTPHSTNFYYTSIFDALKKVCEVWDLEMQFFVEMNGNRIGGRYIDFKRRIGEAVGKRVVYGHNALQILQEVERTNIFTALVGRGKGEETGDGYGRKITFEDVVWSRTQGKPVDKPKGQKYLELPLMTQQYGIKNADGSMRPKIGFVDFSEEENPEVLIERTYRALVDSARPQLTLKTSSVYLKGVKIGDTIRVVRHDKKLDYDTRIFEITFNRLNNQSSDIKLGDRIGESNEAKVQTIADKAVEQFINNEFSTFVQNLPNHLPSADGFNNNWYGAEDPTVQYPGKVLINDIWFKPDPEHEGHKIMLRWAGEVWEEILRTYDSEALRDRIAEEIAQVNQSMQAQSEEHDRQVADILAKTQSVESLANQAKTDAAGAIAQALQSKDEAVADARAQIATVSQALNTAKTDLQNIATYQETVDRKLTELTSSTRTLDGKIDAASAKVDTVAGQIRTEISEVEGKIPITAGTRNLLKGTKELTDIYWTSNVASDYYQGFRIARTAPSVATYIDTYRASTTIVPDATEYIISFYAKSSINGTPINNHFYSPNTTTRSESNTGYIGKGTDGLATINLTTTWQRYWIKWTQTPSNTKKNVIIGRNFSANNATVEIAGVALYEGSLNKDWSPAPEDINDELSSVKTTITQTSRGVEQLSTSLATTDNKVTTAETKIRNLVNEVSSKVSQTDYNTLTGRVDSAETAITQNATEISKRLTSTQVESAITSKGYQTKSDVDSNITGRGYITNSALQPYALSTTVQTLVKETADSFSRTISETRALIPTEVGGRNYFSGYQFNQEITSGNYQNIGSFIQIYNRLTYPLLEADGKTFTISFEAISPNGDTSLQVYNANGNPQYFYFDRTTVGTATNVWKKFKATVKPITQATYTSSTNSNRLEIYAPSKTGVKVRNIKVELGTVATDWSPAPEDLVTVTALHSVRDTVDSHTRTIGAVGESGSILDNVSKVTQTAAGLVQEVSGTNGLKTQVSTLAGSYAIKNLTNSGTVLNQLNLNKDG